MTRQKIHKKAPAGEPATRPGQTQTADLLRKVRRLEIRSRHLVEDLFAGQAESVFKGRGVEFEEVRPYVPGDEVRDIDWNVTARLGLPYVKRFVEERELTVMLVVDVSRSMRFGTAGAEKRELAAVPWTNRLTRRRLRHNMAAFDRKGVSRAKPGVSS